MGTRGSYGKGSEHLTVSGETIPRLWMMRKRRGLRGLELQAEASRFSIDLQIAEEQYMEALSHKWLRKARENDVDVPERIDGNGLWEEGAVAGWYLTDKANQLKIAVRREERESLEMLFRWATLYIGLLSVATGLVAVIKG